MATINYSNISLNEGAIKKLVEILLKDPVEDVYLRNCNLTIKDLYLFVPLLTTDLPRNIFIENNNIKQDDLKEFLSYMDDQNIMFYHIHKFNFGFDIPYISSLELRKKRYSND